MEISCGKKIIENIQHWCTAGGGKEEKKGHYIKVLHETEGSMGLLRNIAEEAGIVVLSKAKSVHNVGNLHGPDACGSSVLAVREEENRGDVVGVAATLESLQGVLKAVADHGATASSNSVDDGAELFLARTSHDSERGQLGGGGVENDEAEAVALGELPHNKPDSVLEEINFGAAHAPANVQDGHEVHRDGALL